MYTMYWKVYKPSALGLLGALFCVSSMQAQTTQADSLFLTVDQLFDRGVRNSLLLQADALKEKAAGERTQTARSAQLPDLQVGLKGGYVGQPTVFQHGLTDAVHPDVPDWSQNYAIDFAQPLYQGGKIHSGIRKADLEQELASLQTQTDQAEVKLGLMEQYLNLFSLYRKYEVLTRNIEESERRLHDIIRMKQEGLITNNDVLRSEMQLTNDRLSLQETENSIALVSQHLNILLGQEENLLLIPDTALLFRSVALETYEDYVTEAFANAPGLKQLRKQTELAQNDVRLTRAVSLPSVSLYASNTLARPLSRTLEDMYNNNWNVGMAVSVPLSSFYKNNHKLKESKLAVTLRRNAEEQKMQTIRVNVRTAYLRHQEALRQVEALKLSVRQAEENYRIMQNRYLSQLVILTDLLDANSVRLNVELQLTTARTRVIYTYYQLQKACGRL
jgi:outer membrane protein